MRPSSTVGLILWLSLVGGAPAPPVPPRIAQILHRVFPEADAIRKRFVYLTREQQRTVQAQARVPVESRLYIFYEVRRGHHLVGTAAVDTHILRTEYETILVIFNPQGTVRRIEILAFEEPPDYLPSDRWLALLYDRSLDEDLRIGRAIPNITGATITAHTIVRRVRLLMAVWQVIYGGDL